MQDTKKEGDKMKNTMKKPVAIPAEKLHPFAGHPFKVKDDEEMNTLIESVQTQGILSPLIVRPIENTDEYEVISGHRRLHAAVKAGITEVPALIVSLDRDAAAIVLVDSNLHREHILPSEKAFAYKMRLEAMNRQGKRMDLTCAPVEHKLNGAKSRDILGNEVGESREQVRRYIRLTNLVSELLELVDEGKIKMRPAVELSYLDEDCQRAIVDEIDMNQCTPSHDQSIRMRKMFEEGKLTPEAITAIMTEQKPNQRERFIIRGDRVRSLIPKSVPLDQTEEYIVKALKYYADFMRKRTERDSR